MKKYRKIILIISIAILLATALVTNAAAAGNVSTAIEQTWNAAKTQIRSVVDNVVFPAIDLVLAVLFFVKIGTVYLDYRKHGQFDFTAPAILFACLLFSLTAPLYLWGIIGMPNVAM